MPAFSIRAATANDVLLILDFIRALAEYEKLTHEITATPAQMAEYLFGSHPRAEVLFPCEDGTPVGFALFFHNFSTWLGRPGLYLEDLFVRPNRRGKGYGRALLERLAQIAQERGCGRMEWAVLDWNEPAHNFYRTLGAAPLDDWTVWRV